MPRIAPPAPPRLVDESRERLLPRVRLDDPDAPDDLLHDPDPDVRPRRGLQAQAGARATDPTWQEKGGLDARSLPDQFATQDVFLLSS